MLRVLAKPAASLYQPGGPNLSVEKSKSTLRAPSPTNSLDGRVTTASYRFPVRPRRCRECQRVFRPSSGHLRCPSCRSKSVCTCGASKQLKSGTCGQCRSESGDTNSNWKGGRSRHKAGYVMVRIPIILAPGSIRMCSNTSLSQKTFLAGIYWMERQCITAIAFATTTDRKNSNFGLDPSQPASASVMPSPGAHEIIERYENDGAPPTALTITRESPWRWPSAKRSPLLSGRRKCSWSGRFAHLRAQSVAQPERIHPTFCSGIGQAQRHQSKATSGLSHRGLRRSRWIE